ncbi:HNH endonuclease [Streptacidiphilus cavernicola]|uniref:HNH endonuclease n=1 Tax=Streptacidiphilus cavernicola TaxID=3342716 RepID=A0ABV6VW46_9ACTN
MSVNIRELTDASAVLRAISEYDTLGQRSFLKHYEYGKASQYYLRHQNRLYDAKAIAGAAYGYQHRSVGAPAKGQFSGGESHSNAALRQLGFTVMDGRPETLDGESEWRQAVWEHLVACRDANGLVTPDDLRSVGAYGGQQGIWVDKDRTKRVHPKGLAVGLKHTGTDYPDEVSDKGALYHYPTTARRGQDEAEVAAAKLTARLKLPVFLISERANLRSVDLAWVTGWEDQSKLLFVTFSADAPTHLLDKDHSDEQPFSLEGNRRRRGPGTVITRPDQARFKLAVFQRYGPVCALSGVAVPEMIEAAHLRPDADNGSSDARNGLPLNAALHRAFDANLFAIHPDTREILVRPKGPSLAQLGIIKTHLSDLAKQPHRSALAWRYDRWLEKNNLKGS